MTAFQNKKQPFKNCISNKIKLDSDKGASALVLRQGEVTLLSFEQACEDFEEKAAEIKDGIKGLNNLTGDLQVFISYTLKHVSC